MSLTTRFKSTRIDLRLATKEIVEDQVAVEEPINIYVNDEHVVTLLASPVLKEELALGRLLDEGILRSVDLVTDLRVKGNDVKIKTPMDLKLRIQVAGTAKLIVTACGSTDSFLKLLDRMDKPFVKVDYKVTASNILGMVQELNQRSRLLRMTVGIHSALLFVNGEVAAFAEDVGRHNAVDKVIGIAALKAVNFQHCVLVSSGRQSADLVLKAARVGIPIVVSIRDPMHLGILAAEKTGVTLICYARGQGMRIYTYPERIMYPS